MKTQFKLGEMVRGGPQLRRQYVQRDKPKREWGKEWKPFIVDMKPVEGMYVGWRTYHNGHNDYHGYEEGISFVSESTIKVALIVRTERENPIPVLFDSLERIVPLEHSKAWAIEQAENGLFVRAVEWPDRNWRTKYVDAIKASSLDEWELWNAPHEVKS